MSKIIPDQIVWVSIQWEEQCALNSSLSLGWGYVLGFLFCLFETTFIYDQPERLNNGHMDLDSNVIQVKSEEFHQKT